MRKRKKEALELFWLEAKIEPSALALSHRLGRVYFGMRCTRIGDTLESNPSDFWRKDDLKPTLNLTETCRNLTQLIRAEL